MAVHVCSQRKEKKGEVQLTFCCWYSGSVFTLAGSVADLRRLCSRWLPLSSAID